MAFTRETLSGNVGQGDTITTLFHYETDDTLATVTGANYFDEGADVLEVNDLIVVMGATLGLFRIATNDGTTVTVVAETAEV